MAQTGYTPILIYSSSTTTNAPSAGNLTNSTLGSELAINITDGKLFYKDNANAVQVIAWKTTPTTAGGTGLTSYTAGDLLYYATGTTLSKLAIGASTTILTSSGTAPQWSAASSITVGAATNIAGGAAGSVPYQSGAGATTFVSIGSAYQALQVNAGGTAPSWQASATSTLTTQGDLLYASAANTLARLAKNTTATRYLSNTGTSNNPAWAQIDLTNGVTGTLPTGNGGTGLTSYTANYIPYATATNTLGTSANFTYNGSGLNIGGSTLYGQLTIADASNLNNAARFFMRNNNSDGSNRYGYVSYNSNTIEIGSANESTGAVNNTLLRLAYNLLALHVGTSATNPTVAIEVNSSGDVKASKGNVVIGTVGKGIDFSANSHAAGMTSELLTWYEEGGWSPTVNFGGATTGITYSRQNGRYTRVGKVVTVNWDVRLSSKGSATGAFTLTGLPFTSEGVAAGGGYPVGMFYFYSGFTTIKKMGMGYNNGSTSLNEIVDSADVAVSDTHFGNSSILFGSFTYIAA